MIKQIAGRAGRRSSQFQQGVATCFNPAEIGRLREAIDVRGQAGGREGGCCLCASGFRRRRCRCWTRPARALCPPL